MNRVPVVTCALFAGCCAFGAGTDVAQGDGKPFLYDGIDLQIQMRSNWHEDAQKILRAPLNESGGKDVMFPIAADLEAGFISLFNGENLEGWEGDTEGYAVENGVMVCKPGGNIYTSESFKNFVFRFEFKLPPAGNNGLGIFMQPGDGDGAFDAIELQILDDGHEKYKDIQPYQAHGSVYGIAPAKRGFLKPVGEWNEQEVIVQDRHITVILNGETIVDVNLDEALKDGPMDDRDHPGALRNEGRIGFLGHGDVVEFRNMRVKPLSETEEG